MNIRRFLAHLLVKIANFSKLKTNNCIQIVDLSLKIDNLSKMGYLLWNF